MSAFGQGTAHIVRRHGICASGCTSTWGQNAFAPLQARATRAAMPGSACWPGLPRRCSCSYIAAHLAIDVTRAPAMRSNSHARRCRVARGGPGIDSRCISQNRNRAAARLGWPQALDSAAVPVARPHRLPAVAWCVTRWAGARRRAPTASPCHDFVATNAATHSYASLARALIPCLTLQSLVLRIESAGRCIRACSAR